MKEKSKIRPRNIAKIAGGLLLFLVLIVAAFGVMLQKFPSVGAYGADYLRRIIGQEATAYLEMYVFRIQDTVKSTEYSLNIEKPASPWQEPDAMAVIAPTATSAPFEPTEAVAKNTAIVPTVEPAWMPPEVAPMGSLSGVGVWQPYITNAAGKVVAYRTFLQPDPKRPYTITGIVAINIEETRLHYMLGFDEPYVQGVQRTSQGVIPKNYFKPDVLLAVFNGGFKVEHGVYGSMLDGYETVPPRNEFGTLAIYKDGHFDIGEWGKDFTLTPDMAAYRQNGPLVIRDGEKNPKVEVPEYWGYTITGATVSWRTGAAVDKERKTLYFVIGPYLSIDMLAQVMQALHAWDAMQLEINNYWTIFEAFPVKDGKLTAEPLMPDLMNDNVERFFQPYARDFFYVTDAAAEPVK